MNEGYRLATFIVCTVFSLLMIMTQIKCTRPTEDKGIKIFPTERELDSIEGRVHSGSIPDML